MEAALIRMSEFLEFVVNEEPPLDSRRSHATHFDSYRGRLYCSARSLQGHERANRIAHHGRDERATVTHNGIGVELNAPRSCNVQRPIGSSVQGEENHRQLAH